MKVLKSSTIVAFLEARDWKVKEKDERYLYVNPPSWMSEDETNMFHVPQETFRSKPDYSRILNTLVKSISEIYEIEVELLEKIFMLSVGEIEANIRYKNIFYPDNIKA